MRATALKIAAAAGLAGGLATGAVAQQKNVTIGVSIPAATHGWTGGVVYHAQETAKLLEKGYPGLKVIVKTSPDGAAQANALDDLTAQKIDALVVLPFNSDELTNPVTRGQEAGHLHHRRRPRPQGSRRSRTSTSPATTRNSAGSPASTSSTT